MVQRPSLFARGERELTTPSHLAATAFKHKILLVLLQSQLFSTDRALLCGYSWIMTAQNRLLVLMLHA